MVRLYYFLCLAIFLVNGATTAHAEQRVGEAALIKNQVVRVEASASNPISVGDGVVRDEIVRTGLDSAARLVMADNTNLSLGPGATLKIDRTVFSGERSYRDIAVNLTGGAFRFVTGDSDKRAYTITTPVATMGVRGTVLDILSQPGRTVVVLQEGASRVCARATATHPVECVELTRPGDTAIVTSVGIQKTNTPPWTFASNCSATAGLCSVTQYASAIPGDGSDPTGMLCGR